MNFDTVKLCASRNEIHAQIKKMWKTDLFRLLHTDKQDFVYGIVERFAQLPRFFFEMTDKHLEWAHFSTWWSGISYREYENPYIHDLYLIHEMAHAGRMVYVPGMTFENFTRKMTDNELEASVVSEIQTYLEIPELREVSFKHEIYADRILKDADLRERYKINPELTFEELKVVRRNVMMNTHTDDTSDYWIHRFYTQNAAWAACWAHRYDQIEHTMAQFRDNCLFSREDALNKLIENLYAFSGGEFSIPFVTEARAFAGVYWANRVHYDAAMKHNVK